VFVEPGELVSTVRFYEQLTGARLDMDADIPESGLHVSRSGPSSCASSPPSSMAWPPRLRSGCSTLIASRPSRAKSPPAPRSSGTRLRHPDGLIVEYVEHRPSEADATTPGPAFA
jgi:hypothetical protein